MSTDFPGAIDSFDNPNSSDPLTSPSHADQHADENDAIVAIETALGVKHGSRVKAVRSTSQTITTGTNTAVQFNAADEFDTDAFHDPSSNNTRVTVPTGMGGVYLCVGTASWAASGTGNRIIYIAHNGSGNLGGLTVPGAASNTQHMTATAVLVLAAGDYVQMFVFHSVGSNHDITSANFVVVKIA